MRLPIRVRLAALHLAVLAVVLGVVAVVVPRHLGDDLARQTDQSLVQRAGQLSEDYAREGDGEFIENANAALSGLVGTASWAQLLAPDGTLVKTSGDSPAAGAAISTDTARAVLGGGPRMITTELGPQRQTFRLIARPLDGKTHRDVLVVATSTDLIDNVVSQLASLLVMTGLVAVGLAAAGVWWVSRLALLPITTISRQADRIHVNHLDERIPVPHTADEVGHLARTLNAMFDRLRDGVEQHRRLVADASHELRTPLAIMRAELDVALAAPGSAAVALEHNAAEVDRMTRIVANLLTLARIDRGELELLRRPIDLATEAATVAARFTELANGKQVRLRVEGGAGLVEADRERIDQVLSNLVDNAVKYTATGTVTIQVWQRDGEAGVSVVDTGPGISADEVGRVFDRFYRIDCARTRSAGGSGLGLAISQEIIRVHAGRIWVDSVPGRGSRFSFALPA